MPTITMRRQFIGECYTVTVDDAFVMSSPSKHLAAEAVMDQVRHAGGTATVVLDDHDTMQARTARIQASLAKGVQPQEG